MKTKKLAILTCIVLVLVVGVGATLAWLTDKTEPVVNTFSPSTITVELEEETEGPYEMVPGHDIAKDPKAWIEQGSEECYLFVKVQENGVVGTATINGEAQAVNYAFGDFLDYGIANDWTPLTDVAGVYWIKVDGTEGNGEFGTKYSILENDEISVLPTVTKEMMDILYAPVKNENVDAVYPTLTFTAYAAQLYKDENNAEFTPNEAWNIAQGLNADGTPVTN